MSNVIHIVDDEKGIRQLFQKLLVKNWNWGITMGKLKITSKVDGEMSPVRMSITDKTGHPIIPKNGIVHSEGQNGIVFFYSSGVIEVSASNAAVKFGIINL